MQEEEGAERKKRAPESRGGQKRRGWGRYQALIGKGDVLVSLQEPRKLASGPVQTFLYTASGRVSFGELLQQGHEQVQSLLARRWQPYHY
ncbi:hypothetical protein L7F22_062046 [Adiantum nelumboides]|nr:hypothetical protein [Adiantum nelumboides]